MASSKFSLAERVRKELQAVMDTESKVTQQQAILTVGSARDKLVYNRLIGDYQANKSINYAMYLSEFGYDTPLNPTWDADRNLYSLQLPALPIELPRNSGIQDVHIKGQTEYSFVQVEPFSGNMYRGMAASKLPRPTFFQKGGTLYFPPTAVSEKSEIIISEVAQSSGIGDRDTLPIDPSMELDIIALAKEMLLMPDKPEDNITDGVGN